METKNIIETSIIFVIFILILTPVSLADEVSNTYRKKPEDAKGSVVTFCSKPLKVKKDNRFFFFVNKNSSVEEINLVVTKGNIKLIEPLSPSKYGRDNVIREGKKITIKNTTSFILHSSSERIRVATENKNLKLATTQKCAQLGASVAYMNRKSKHEYINKEIKPLDSLYNITKEIMEINNQIERKPCSSHNWRGIEKGSMTCSPKNSNLYRAFKTWLTEKKMDYRYRSLSGGGKAITEKEIEKIYTEILPEEYEKTLQHTDLQEFSIENFNDEHIIEKYNNDYINFLRQHISNEYKNSLNEWYELWKGGETEKLSRSYKVLTDMLKLITTEKIYAYEDSGLLTYEQFINEFLNNELENFDYKIEITTEKPKINFGEVINANNLKKLLPESVLNEKKWELENKNIEIPRLNIYNKDGSLVQSDYIFPVYGESSGRGNFEGFDLKSLPSELKGKSGFIRFNIIQKPIHGSHLSSVLPETLFHESIHSVFEAKGYNSFYRNKLENIHGFTSYLMDPRVDAEKKALLEGPTMSLTPEALEKYNSGLKKLGYDIGTRYLYLNQWLDYVSVTENSYKNGYFAGEIIFRTAMEEHGLEKIINGEIDLQEEYDIGKIIGNIKNFHEEYTSKMPEKFMDVKRNYGKVIEDLETIIERSGENEMTNQKYGQIVSQTTNGLSQKPRKMGLVDESIKKRVNEIDKIITEYDILFSQSFKNEFDEINSKLLNIIEEVDQQGKVSLEDIPKIERLKINLFDELVEFGLSKQESVFKNLAMKSKEGDFDSNFFLKNKLDPETTARLRKSIRKMDQDIKDIREITRNDPETTKIIETLDRARNSVFEGKLGELTGKRSYWKRAKDFAMESAKDIDWGSLSWFVGAAFAESLGEALREFGKTYDLAWTGWVAGLLHTEGFYDLLYIWGAVLAPKILWAVALIMNKMILAGFKTLFGTALYAASGLLLTGILIGVLTYLLIPLVHIIGAHFLNNTPSIIFENKELKKNSEENVYLVNIENIDNYPLGDRIHIKLFGNNKDKNKIIHASCKIIKGSKGKVCKGKFFVDLNEGKNKISAMYYVTEIPDWFNEVKNKIGERKVTLWPITRNTFLSFRNGEVCIKIGFYKKKCVAIDKKLEDKLYHFTNYKGQTIKIWTERNEVKCGKFDRNGEQFVEDCRTLPIEKELPKGKSINKKIRAKEITVMDGGEKLHGKLEIETKNNDFISKQFTWKDEEMLYEEDLIKK
ncbi:MAG: hypothetical protein ABEK36_00735 [Candidatus Aenigmatarchaeota archaeon]